MNDFGIFIAMLTPLMSAVSQVMLKKSAINPANTGIKTYLNPLVVAAYALFFSCMLLNVVALKTVDLSLAGMLECLGYLYIMVLSGMVFKEKFTPKKIVGNLIIIVGIIIGAIF